MFDWTDERCDELRRLQGMNFSASQIGQRLGGITKNAVIGKLGRLGIQGKRGPKPAPKPATVAKQRKARFQMPPTAPQPPVEHVMERCAAGLEITFMQLQPHHCRYPSGEGRDILFCGRTALDGFAYCPAHCRICYQAPQARRRPDYNPPRVHG